LVVVNAGGKNLPIVNR